ncbi:MAG TPA: O-acetyl-ADP-ribose deacetylase [Candidatus Limnocylindrales bacterium]|nr:O-acetyl-ADP-ribose deacetylase [Candidatus Limnocylindrales bacterium]
MIRALIKQTSIELVQGDITLEGTDAIVNAANASLSGGGGVDGAIHRAAGPGLMAECSQIGGCPTGDARITGAYKLRSKHVIHAVGPVYEASNTQTAFLLASAYQRSLELALNHRLRSIAFPSISTGAYGYPAQEAAAVALATGVNFITSHTGSLDLMRWVLYDQYTYAAYATTLAAIAMENNDLRLM